MNIVIFKTQILLVGLFILLGQLPETLIAQGHHSDNNHNGIWVDSLEVINIAGTIMVDSSYFYHHYYIDIDEDNTPDYLLNFGPPWYSPPSEAVRPSHGNKVTILGGLHLDHFGTISVMVYELNGEKWRESTGPHPWSGSWMHRDAVGSTTIYCPSDSLSWMNHPSGSMMGGMMFPDSVFCQFEEIHPEFVPGDYDSTLFACYYMNMFEPDGTGMMNEMGSNGMMRFNRSTKFRFHYDEMMMNDINQSDGSIQMKYWDEISEQWKVVIDYELDQVNHTISFAGMDMYNYYGIFAYGNSLSVNEIDFTNQIGNIKLFQNYPNPFTTETRINFNLLEDQHITMTIYDLQGRKVKTLIENQLPAGNHSVTWNGSSDSQPVGPGNYILKIQSQNQVSTLNIVYKK